MNVPGFLVRRLASSRFQSLVIERDDAWKRRVDELAQDNPAINQEALKRARAVLAKATEAPGSREKTNVVPLRSDQQRE